MNSPYDQAADEAFDQITKDYYRHPGGRTMNQQPRSSTDQMRLMLGCGGMAVLIAIAVAVVLIAWSFL